MTAPRPLRALAAMLLVAALIAPATPVLAWGTSGDGYGSHDWIIDAAVRVLDGRADWFDAEVAKAYSDDPDTVEVRVYGENEHVYRFVGRRGGAVGRAADHFDLALAAYRAGAAADASGDGDAAGAGYREASKQIGLLSHFVGDVAQPFHSAYAGIDKDPLHHGYELLVNNARRASDARPDWQSTRRTPAAITNVRTTASGTARYSAGLFAELPRRLKADGVRLTTRIAEITGAVMKRATNDLADIIWSVERGVGAQTDIGSLRMTLRWTGIRSGDNQLLTVKALDVDGRPTEGLKVIVRWPTSTGTLDHLTPARVRLGRLPDDRE